MTAHGTVQAAGAAADRNAQSESVVDILVASLNALAAAGEVEAACRLAGRAYVVSRCTDKAAARRFDVLLHRLTPKLTW